MIAGLTTSNTSEFMVLLPLAHQRQWRKDEPFRGLDRDQRHTLVGRARTYWHDETLLCITHDVGETQAFDRVWVMERGQLVEDAPPAALAARADSRYRALLDEEIVVQERLWEGAAWRWRCVEDGRVSETVGI